MVVLSGDGGDDNDDNNDFAVIGSGGCGSKTTVISLVMVRVVAKI